jgi:glucokinase
MTKLAYGGIDLGGTTVQYGLVDENGELLYRGENDTRAGREEILGNFFDIVRTLKIRSQEQELKLVAVGVGSAGIVDPHQGKIIGRSPNVPGWDGTDVKRELETETGLPTFADNDANVMALAEHRLGAGKDFENGLYLTIGTGIGSGIILGNKLLHGADFAAAEIGHMIIVKNGRECPCGKRGCLEVYANAAAFKRYYGKLLPPSAGVKDVFRMARQGDRTAEAAIATAADYLACGLGSALELLNPEVVVIGGGIAAGHGYLKIVREQLPNYCTEVARAKVKIKRAKLGNTAGLLGAALLARENSA